MQRLIMILIFISQLTGCVSRQDALQLANAGLAATKSADAGFRDLRQSAHDSLEWFEISATIGELAVQNVDGARQTYSEDIKTYTNRIDSRADMLTQLAGAYAALHNLATQNFGADISSASNDLSESVIAYNRATGETNEALVKLITASTAAIAEGIQQRVLYKANRGFADLIESKTKDGKEIGILPALRLEHRILDAETGNFDKRKLDAVNSLMELGIVSPAPLLTELTSKYGLAVESKRLMQEIQQANNHELRSLITQLLTIRLERGDQLRAESLKSIIKVFEKLRLQHLAAENPWHVSTNELQVALGHLREVASAARDYRNALQAARVAAREENAAKREKRMEELGALIEMLATRLGTTLPTQP